MTMDKTRAVGHIPSGLFIVCAMNAVTGKTAGYLASWIQQVSFDPLLISLAIKPGRPAYDLIMGGNVFTINIIGSHENEYMKLFWSGYNPVENPFEKLSSRKGEAGGIILEAAKSAIECRMHSTIKPGDHVLVIAEVLNSYILHEEAAPLVHVRESGSTY